jgi:hypothetical protein
MSQTAQQSAQRIVQQLPLLFVNLDLNEKAVEFWVLRMD